MSIVQCTKTDCSEQCGALNDNLLYIKDDYYGGTYCYTLEQCNTLGGFEIAVKGSSSNILFLTLFSIYHKLGLVEAELQHVTMLQLKSLDESFLSTTVSLNFLLKWFLSNLENSGFIRE